MRARFPPAVPWALPVLLTGAPGQHPVPAEAWIELRKQFRPQGPAPSIPEDVAALATGEARRAAPRLLDRGPEALPALHAALRAPGVEPRHALALLQVVGAFQDPASVPVLLDLLRRDPATPLRRDLLWTLACLPATEPAAAFMGALAADGKEPWRTRRMAFTWFALHRDPRGRPLAEGLRADPDPGRRAAALFVLARLGDASALEPVTRMLAEGAPAGARDGLLLALGELATPEDFERRAPKALAWSPEYRDGLRQARFRAAKPADRTAACLELLQSEVPGHREAAVRCLLANGQAQALRPYAAVDLEVPGRDARVRLEIRRAGWRIVDTDTEFRIEPGNPAPRR